MIFQKVQNPGGEEGVRQTNGHEANNITEEKNDFWEDLDGLIESVSKEERIVLGADLNEHVGEGNIGDEEIMGRYGAGTRIGKNQWL